MLLPHLGQWSVVRHPLRPEYGRNDRFIGIYEAPERLSSAEEVAVDEPDGVVRALSSSVEDALLLTSEMHESRFCPEVGVLSNSVIRAFRASFRALNSSTSFHQKSSTLFAIRALLVIVDVKEVDLGLCVLPEKRAEMGGEDAGLLANTSAS
jgi:hypothetical protein